MVLLQHLKCQFGNILFQLITGTYFAKQYSLDYYYSSYAHHEIHFDSDYNYILKRFNYYGDDYNKIENFKNNKNTINLECNFIYKKIPFIKDKNYYIDGYCQNWNYINYNYAIETLSPTNDILNKINNILSLNEIKTSIGIHLRFKEYDWAYKDFCNDTNRLEKFIKNHKNKRILIFTDDISKVIKFKLYDNVLIFSEKSNSFLLDFYTLTLCKYLVGGLSTFFIWALYLNLNKPEIYYIKESLDHYNKQGIEFKSPNYIYNDYNFNPNLFKEIL